MALHISPLADVDPQAELGDDVQIGPFCVIGPHVRIGDRCRLDSHVVVTGHTAIGADNRFFPHCVIGAEPQDYSYCGSPTRVEIGEANMFREGVTVNRGAEKEDHVTRIGNHNLLLANSHVAHNCQIGDHVVIANGALLGGHVMVQERAFISGNCVVHQFVRVGTLAIMQGGSAISQDLPPFTVARGENGICGLNTVGLRRAGFTGEARLELKRLYHALFRGGKNLKLAITAARGEFSTPAAKVLLDFVAGAKRGVCADVGRDTERLRASGREEAELSPAAGQ